MNELSKEDLDLIHDMCDRFTDPKVPMADIYVLVEKIRDRFPKPEINLTKRPMKLRDDVKVIVKPGDINKVIVTRPIDDSPELAPYTTEWDYSDFSYLFEPIPVEPVKSSITPEEARELLAKGKEFQDALKPQLAAAMGMSSNEPEPMFKVGDKVEFCDYSPYGTKFNMHEGVVLCAYQFACDVLIFGEQVPRYLSSKSIKKCTNTK